MEPKSRIGQVFDRLNSFSLVQKPSTSDLAKNSSTPKPTLERADQRYAIVAQADGGEPQQGPPGDPPRGPAWRPIALWAGAAGALVLGGWLLWPHLPFNQPAAEPAVRSLALRPTFTPTPQSGEKSSAATAFDPAATPPMQIIIVTPTPNPARQIVVGGTVVDRPLAVAGSEQLFAGIDAQPAVGVALASAASVNGAQQLVQTGFDPASVVVPPMVEEVANEPLAQVEVRPLPGLEPIATSAPTLVAPELPPTPTPLPELIVGPTRKWSDFAPLPPEQSDHLWVGPAFLEQDGYNQIGAPSYSFGSTGGGRYRPHHGLDVANPSGTPVRAGVSGEVVHAGLDDPALLGPYNNFYGNAVVIRLDQKLPVGGGQLDVFLLYGHLSQVNVQVGQRVQPTDVVGAVGMTGIAIGPHLHVEMRLGVNDYQHSANPYLWLKPLPGNGAVAVRLITQDGLSWPGQRLTLARFENGQAVWGRAIETYLDNENIGPDPIWGENGAMGDVPAGYYVIVGNVNGESVRAEFFVREGQTTFVEIRTKQ